MRTPRPGPTSSTTSRSSSLASRPITPRMFSSARKCWPSRFLGRTLTATRRRRTRWRRSARRARRRPRHARPASAATVWTTCAGSFALAADRLRREVGAVGLRQDPVGGHLGGRGPELCRLRIGDVAREREVPAAVEPRRQQPRLREAVHDDRAVVTAQDRLRVRVRRARVDDDREARARRRARAGPRRAGAARPSVGAVVVVEPASPTATAAGWPSSSRSSSTRSASSVPAWCGSMPSAA